MRQNMPEGSGANIKDGEFPKIFSISEELLLKQF
jgi:hypothetical protein